VKNSFKKEKIIFSLCREVQKSQSFDKDGNVRFIRKQLGLQGLDTTQRIKDDQNIKIIGIT
jgi:hypothetical protein